MGHGYSSLSIQELLPHYPRAKSRIQWAYAAASTATADRAPLTSFAYPAWLARGRCAGPPARSWRRRRLTCDGASCAAFVVRDLLESFETKAILGYQHSGFSVDAGLCIQAHTRAILDLMRLDFLFVGNTAGGAGKPDSYSLTGSVEYMQFI